MIRPNIQPTLTTDQARESLIESGAGNIPGHDLIRGSLNPDSYQALLLNGYLDLYSNGMADPGSYGCCDVACLHGWICPQTSD